MDSPRILVSALGKAVTANDFSEYMIFHNRKIFANAYQPRPFCSAVRRPDHFPEGMEMAIIIALRKKKFQF